MNSFSLEHCPVNWFDLLVVIVVLLGCRKGRMNGMSVEVVPMVQWIAIVAVGALLYAPLGDMLADMSQMGHLFCYITVYVLLMIVTKTIFTMIKKGAGGKLLGSNIFGGAEFYLGAGAGAVRFLCILLAGMAVLNAPYYSTQEVAAKTAYQTEMYGSTLFPGFSNLQIQVFKESFLGSFVKKQAEFVLIASTKNDGQKLQRRKDDLP